MDYFANSPAFDAAAVEQLNFYQRRVAILIADGDPDPNQIQTLALYTPIGSWELKLAADGVTWTVAGQPVGESVQRECGMLVAFQAADSTDLRDYQGPKAAGRYGR